MRRIALITDFGTRDPYAAAMKGVIASRTAAPILDLTHDIAPFDVWQAAFFLQAVIRYWPDETIFVTVVDPGVGTLRRILAIESKGRLFLAPDNGALTFVDGQRFSVENESLFLPDSSTTFHGRDRFAPVAAALANGVPIEQLGPRFEDFVRLEYTPPVYGRDRITGTVVSVDRFGNLITDIERARIPLAAFALHVGDTIIDRVETTYRGDGPILIVGSTGCIEVSIASESAAALLRLSRGDRVTIVPV